MTDFKPYPKEVSIMSSKEYREQSFKYNRKKSKYNNKSTNYNGNHYDSKFECKYAQDLDYRIDIGEVESWERQVKIPLSVNEKHIANYYIDFKVVLSDGTIQYVEVKGYETPLWKMKWNLLLAIKDEVLEEGIELIVVKK